MVGIKILERIVNTFNLHFDIWGRLVSARFAIVCIGVEKWPKKTNDLCHRPGLSLASWTFHPQFSVDDPMTFDYYEDEVWKQ